MGLLQTAIKFYLIVLLFRTAMTRQELYFNPLGKIVGKMTDPVLEKAFKLTKKSADNMLPLFVMMAIFIEAIVFFMISGDNIVLSLLKASYDIVGFLMLFYIVSVIIGSFAGNAQMSHYAMFFHRLASFWVKFARTFFPIKSNLVIIPAVIIIFAFFTLLNIGLTISFQFFSGNVDILNAVTSTVRSNIFDITGLLDAFVWLIIIRSLLSWVSPDPRNPVVQLIVSITDPIMEPFRKVIPTIGGIDISPMLLIFVVYFMKTMIVQLVGMII
ncbi:MAG: YggT family protein [Denitrovibrio sp.]|nr:MAG: YggT family protein [Denitrovibrio sp.]